MYTTPSYEKKIGGILWHIPEMLNSRLVFRINLKLLKPINLLL